MLFGWRRVSPRLHLFATCMVALGTLVSDVLDHVREQLDADAGGLRKFGDGVFHAASWWDVIFNPHSRSASRTWCSRPSSRPASSSAA